jgi:hypothetical protein
MDVIGIINTFETVEETVASIIHHFLKYGGLDDHPLFIIHYLDYPLSNKETDNFLKYVEERLIAEMSYIDPFENYIDSIMFNYTLKLCYIYYEPINEDYYEL